MSFYKEVPGRKTTLESTLKFDTEPKAGSTNPVTSDGVKNAIDGAVGDAAEAIQEQIDEIAEKAGSGYIPKGEASVATLNALTGQENGWLYTLTDDGTLTDGSIAVVAGDTVAWDDANSVWYKAMDYAPRQYGTDQVKNLPTTITAFRTGDVIPVDGPLGPAKMAKDDLLATTNDFVVNGNTQTKSSFSDAIDIVIEIKEGDTFDVLVSTEHSGTTFSVYAFYGAGSGDYDQLSGVLENTSKQYVAAKNYRKIRLYKEGRGYNADCSVHVLGLSNDIEKLDTAVSELTDNVNGRTKSASSSLDSIDIGIEISLGETFELSVDTTHSGNTFSVYAFYGSGVSDYDQLSGVLENTPNQYVAAKNYIKIRFYKASRGYEATCSVNVFGVEQTLSGLETRTTSVENEVEYSKQLVLGNSITKTFTTSQQTKDTSIRIPKGMYFECSATAEHTGTLSVYAYKSDGTYDEYTPRLPFNGTKRYFATNDYVKIRLYNSATVACETTVKLIGSEQQLNELETSVDVNKPLNILVLGDSYTADSVFWRQEFLRVMPEGTTINSTAVIAAKVKDNYADRDSYPYTSRPNRYDNTGNHNTFGSQIEKLKRLMAGVDLDEGETQWYANGASPDVVIIEGGQNDSPDANMDDYIEQYEVLKSGAFYKEDRTSAVQEGYCFAKPTLDEIDRLTFAGAYRYVCETIKQLFPHAQFFVTTTSNLHYWTAPGGADSGSRMRNIFTKGEQQRWCARACGAEIIDWQTAQLTCLTSCPGGSGTSDDPYILSNNGQTYSDSNDGLHPNEQGGRKLGAFMANEILKKFSKHVLY